MLFSAATNRSISPRGTIRYIVNTDEREEFTGGNEKLAAAGNTIRFRIATDPRVSDALDKDRASVISFVTVFQRMSAPTGKASVVHTGPKTRGRAAWNWAQARPWAFRLANSVM